MSAFVAPREQLHGPCPAKARRYRSGGVQLRDACDLAAYVLGAILGTRGRVALFIYPDNTIDVVHCGFSAEALFDGYCRGPDSLVGVYASGVTKHQIQEDILSMRGDDA